MIIVQDATTDGSATFTVTVYPNNSNSSSSQDYTIYWTVVSDGVSPYLIQLDNDSATIGTNAEGGGYNTTTLKNVSTVNVTVHEGSLDITDQCDFEWDVSGGTLDNYNSESIYFKTLASTDATATVTVKKNDVLIGTKQFSISKNK
jgi:hypothetical protein